MLFRSDVGDTSFGTGDNIEAATNPVFNAVTNVAQIYDNMAALPAGAFVQDLSFTLVNNVRGVKGIGYLGNAAIGAGKLQITGTLNTYFNDNSFYQKFLAGTSTVISFRLTDANGKSYIITFPKVKIESDPGPQVPGENQDVTENLTWRAFRDPITDCTVQIDKFGTV